MKLEKQCMNNRSLTEQQNYQKPQQILEFASKAGPLKLSSQGSYRNSKRKGQEINLKQ